MDIKTKEQRSLNMSHIKSENTKPKQELFGIIESLNVPYEKHYKITGKPDAVFLDHKVAILVDGEFWHGKEYSKWKDNVSEFWKKKISDNIKRDKKINRILKKEGWEVLHIWGKDLIRNPEKYSRKISKLTNAKSQKCL